MKTFQTYQVAPEHHDLTLEFYLKQILQCSGRKMQKLTRKKGILLNGHPAYLQKKLKTHDKIQILVLEDSSYGAQAEPGNLTVLYEDEYLWILNKPAGQLTHPAGQTTNGTLANYLAYHLQQQGIVTRIRPVHRLDRDTSGCVVFAKDAESQTRLEQQLKSGTLKRTYWALVQGRVQPPSGLIDAPIGPHPRLANRRAVTPLGQEARTFYETLCPFEESTLLKLQLETGRTHQIRVHLAYLGFPIWGDSMYGARCSWLTRQALHAASIQFFSLKNGQQITVEATLPADFKQALEHCRT